jgi:hypothetical protein
LELREDFKTAYRLIMDSDTIMQEAKLRELVVELEE